MFKKIYIIPIMILCLTGCTQSSYISGNSDAKDAAVIIMPEQKCTKKDNGRKLIGEKILHPAHKECYYKRIYL